ncbi:MAG: hypothetical protein E6K77_02410 [Candidatus Eisenbacteria bacterium]|uniref:Lipoprotein n=1 Tax=Eiseniibacteriota bacterium TaxID=2212470 RepID=A0A538TPW4_UNCEI|nr:MAG: hypothetical protein E6K74_07590 [Candidatus Eisenbacteria bacterium]TMQ65667.1 MAG: hypothetical protein E6K77_02410 [Candidatus Eisenbacteria bacterium]
MNRPTSTAVRAAGILALPLVLMSCSSWHSIGKGPPADYVAREKPRSVRVSLAESTLVLSRPIVRGDTVVGLDLDARPVRPVALPAADIRNLEVPSPKGSTAAKVVVGTFWVTGLALAVAFAFHRDPGIP